MRYAPEPVPAGLEPELAEFLTRQLILIAQASDSQFIVPVVYEIPETTPEGSIIYLKDDGMYVCISQGGDKVWKKLVTQ
jgi:hypothetical protein